MAPRIAPLDETEFNQPAGVGDFGFGPGSFVPTDVNYQNVLYYFYQSHFFDRNAVNWGIWGNALQQHATPVGQRLLNDPRAFEERLDYALNHGGGFGYKLVAEAKEPGEPWVIQRHRKWMNEVTKETDMQVEGTWYIIGTRILMAPSLLDVLQARLVSLLSSTSLFCLFSMSPLFSFCLCITS